MKDAVRALIECIAIPRLDLRAFVLSAIASSAFAAWSIVSVLAEGIYYRDPVATVAGATVGVAFDWLVLSMGNAAVAIGGALWLQRKAATLKPLALTISALAIISLLLLVRSVWFAMWQMIPQLQQPEAPRLWLGIATHLLQVSSQLVGVAVASRLYVSWRRPISDPLDGRRFSVLIMLALIFAFASIFRSTYVMLMLLSPDSINANPTSVPIIGLSWIYDCTLGLVLNAGIVILFGYTLIDLLGRADKASDVRWVTFASVGAALATAVRRSGRVILQPRHGERGSVLTEAWYFSRPWWLARFRAAGFTIEAERPVGLFYTGHSLVGARLGPAARRRLAGRLGSACRVYVMVPAASS